MTDREDPNEDEPIPFTSDDIEPYAAKAGEGTLRTLAEAYADARAQYNKAEAIAKMLKEDSDAAEADLFNALEAAGLRSIRSERGLFRLNDLAWAQIVDRDAAIAWAEANLPEIINLNSSRLSKLVRDQLKGEVVIEGAAPSGLPPGVDFTASRSIGWTQS